MEARLFPEAPDLRMDIVSSSSNSDRNAVDVGFTDPTSPTYLSGSASTDGHAASKYATDCKIRKYKALCDRHDYTLIPFILEYYGRIGPAAMDFLRRTGLQAETNKGIPRRMFYTYWRRRLSVCAQKGIATAMLSGICSTTRVAHHAPFVSEDDYNRTVR